MQRGKQAQWHQCLVGQPSAQAEKPRWALFQAASELLQVATCSRRRGSHPCARVNRPRLQLTSKPEPSCWAAWCRICSAVAATCRTTNDVVKGATHSLHVKQSIVMHFIQSLHGCRQMSLSHAAEPETCTHVPLVFPRRLHAACAAHWLWHGMQQPPCDCKGACSAAGTTGATAWWRT